MAKLQFKAPRRFYLFSPWRRPPTGHATLCNDPAPVFHGGALCPNRTIRESMRWNAYVWKPIACNWRASFMTPLCRYITFGWRGNGPAWRFGDLRTKNRTKWPHLAYARFTDISQHSVAPSRLLHHASPFRIGLNRSRRRRQEGIEALPDDGIALARCLLETGAIENFNSPPTIADEAGRL
jgi:hypothetical protein